MLKRQARAAEYHGRALDAAALAVASPLDRVRERHEAAAARWRQLAALSERTAPVSPRKDDVLLSFALAAADLQQ